MEQECKPKLGERTCDFQNFEALKTETQFFRVGGSILLIPPFWFRYTSKFDGYRGLDKMTQLQIFMTYIEFWSLNSSDVKLK